MRGEGVPVDRGLLLLGLLLQFHGGQPREAAQHVPAEQRQTS